MTTTEGLTQLTARIPPEWVEMIDEIAKTSAPAGATLNRTEALRAVIWAGIQQLKAAARPTKKR